MKFKIGVFGSAAGEEMKAYLGQAWMVGKCIAHHGSVVVTGACPGLPHEAARAAGSVGGLVLGISPALNLQDHIQRFKFPADDFYMLIFTGMEKKGRNVISLRTCDAAIFISGRVGTLNEFSIAYDEGGEGFVIGILIHTGGISDEIVPLVTKLGKASRSIIITDDDPANLVERIQYKLLAKLSKK